MRTARYRPKTCTAAWEPLGKVWVQPMFFQYMRYVIGGSACKNRHVPGYMVHACQSFYT